MTVGIRRPIRYRLLGIVVIAVAAGTGCSQIPERYAPDNPLPPAELTHALWNRVLAAHVADGRVDYPAIAGDPAFKRYLQRLARINPDRIDDPKRLLALWINAYNAFAVAGVVHGHTPQSRFGKYLFFVHDDYRIGGADVNLYGLEQDILIPMGETRIHFAIVCASHSCPPLRNEAYTAARLDAQLNDQARRFVNDSGHNRFDRDTHVAHLSKIFQWFRDDFAAQAGSLTDYIADYVDDPALARSLREDEWTLRFMEYDWHPNGPLPANAG